MHQRSHRSISLGIVLGLTLLTPLAMEAGAITVNSTCYVGDCANVDSVGNGQSTTGSFDINYTFGDGDEYNISGTYGASYSSIGGSTIAIDPTVNYLGSGPTLGTDTIVLDFYQNYYDPSCCTWAGTYTESVPLNASGQFGAGSEMQGELFYDGVGVGLVGPDPAPGTYFVTESSNLDFGAVDDGLATLSADYNFQYKFGAGTAPGAGETASTPEPASFVLCGFALVLGSIIFMRRNRARISQDQEDL